MPATLKTDIKTVRVWKMPKNGSVVRVATIEQNGRRPVDCSNCDAPCCKGSLMPILNEAELMSGRFKVRFVDAPEWLKEQVPRAELLAVLDVDPNKGCSYLDKNNKCSIFPNCPSSCLSYDCKRETRRDVIGWLGR